MTVLTEIIAPLEQEGTKAVVRTWLKKVGDAVAVNEPIVELETDKVAVEVAAEQAGVLAEIVLEAGAEAGPGAVLGRLSPAGSAAAAPKAEPVKAAEPVAAKAEAPAKSIASFDPELRLSPSVRRFLVENDMEPHGLTGTGRGGRLTREDVQKAFEAGAGKPAPVAKPIAPRVPGAVKTVPHDTMRRKIAQHMSNSVNTAPHVTAVFEADFSAIMADRKSKKAEFERQGVNLTLTAYIVAACVEAMNAVPQVNSRWFDDHIEIYDDLNIGVGTALGDKGLIVPVVKRAQDLSLFGIATRLQEMTERARSNKLQPSDVQGGTFSISNHGVSGSLVATPIIINQPQSAILGVGKLEKRVVVRDVAGQDAILIRPMAYVSLTIDHRVLDGHQTNGWLTTFVKALENWA
jgi:2-oxoglutarate dehydrogenase E2 component (dihydrolipoamide succinyltransferase)